MHYNFYLCIHIGERPGHSSTCHLMCSKLICTALIVMLASLVNRAGVQVGLKINLHWILLDLVNSLRFSLGDTIKDLLFLVSWAAATGTSGEAIQRKQNQISRLRMVRYGLVCFNDLNNVGIIIISAMCYGCHGHCEFDSNTVQLFDCSPNNCSNRRNEHPRLLHNIC